MASTSTRTTRSTRSRKALVAGALGVALLAGGGGTFANWYENTQIASGTVTAGSLTLNADTGTQVWKDQTGKIIDPTTFRMVPGDTVTYTVTATPKLVGDNLKANLAVDTKAVTGTLADFAQISTTLTNASGAVSNPLTPATADGTKPITATVTITLPFETANANGTDAETTTLDLSTVKLNLTQVA